MKSFSEIETISKRASKGAGFSWGVSEEIGKSVRLMEMFGLPGILYLTSYLNQIGNHNYQKMTIISADNISNNIPYCPISVGLNFMDQVHNLEKVNKINFSNLAYPLLIVPFLSRSSEIIGKKILLNLENFKFLFNYNQSIFSNFDNSFIEKTTKFFISFNQNEDSFDKMTWDTLYKISQKTFVDETESSKNTSAGAGLTDND
ncbi:MAG: DUF3726 domain-containing protein [Candidatus Pelagibacter sp.]